jgi:thiamine biosynthesis lipoprotein
MAWVNLPRMPTQMPVLTLLAVLLLLAGCDARDTATAFAGPTMGTTYHILIADHVSALQRDEIQQYIDAELKVFNAHLSTYDPTSEISRLNADVSGEWLAVSPLLFEVIRESARVSAASGGAFDITIGNLVQEWGFGPDGVAPTIDNPVTPPRGREPRRADGWRQLELRAAPVPAVRKRVSSLRLDVNGIAPGVAVDRLVAGLQDKGFRNVLVEIGGEVRGQGRRPDHRPWQIAIEAPVTGERIVYAGLEVLDCAVSTSGDYRDSRITSEGQRISHTIDPHTGQPIANDLASVTVVAPTAATADAFATALSVLGSEKGYALAVRLGLPVLFIERTTEPGKWHERASPAFERLRRPPS